VAAGAVRGREKKKKEKKMSKKMRRFAGAASYLFCCVPE
jgi:hypothetical protein